MLWWRSGEELGLTGSHLRDLPPAPPRNVTLASIRRSPPVASCSSALLSATVTTRSTSRILLVGLSRIVPQRRPYLSRVPVAYQCHASGLAYCCYSRVRAPGDFLPPPPCRLKSVSADASAVNANALYCCERGSPAFAVRPNATTSVSAMRSLSSACVGEYCSNWAAAHRPHVIPCFTLQPARDSY